MKSTRLIATLGLVVLFILPLAMPPALAQDTMAEPAIGLELVADGFAAPLALIPSGDGSGRLFIIDQVGQIWILSPAMWRPIWALFCSPSARTPEASSTP